MCSWLKRAGIVLALIVVIGLGVLGWYATRPGPPAFVAGKTVALDGYRGHSTREHNESRLSSAKAPQMSRDRKGAKPIHNPIEQSGLLCTGRLSFGHV